MKAMWRNKTILAVGTCASIAVAVYYALRKIPNFWGDDELDLGNQTPLSGQSSVMEQSLKVMDNEATPPSLAPPSRNMMDTEATPLSTESVTSDSTSSLELTSGKATPSSLRLSTTNAMPSLVSPDVSCELVDDFTELHKHYEVFETIGSGSFGTVKLGVHIVTGEKVAIKVMEKKHVSNEVWHEIDAMMNLHHKHVCQLYHVIETQNLIYLVLEYCPQGELFDLISENEGFSEVDTRMFFRQIVSALAYVHSQGYAHRDLKPENVLLDEHFNIKLIDFGLCAKPEGGLDTPLTSFCGSPAYIAPELYQDKPYIGSEADVWSLGVVLYTMLCGNLPFEGQTLNKLSKKIMRGHFNTPDWLSLGSVLLLKQMLQVNPKRRVTVQQLLDHQWVMKGYSSPVQKHDMHPHQHLDQDCISEMAVLLNQSELDTIQQVSKWKYDSNTATYLLLLALKQRSSAARATQTSTWSPVDQTQVVVE